MQYIPDEIERVFKNNFRYPTNSIYMQIATAKNNIPTIRTVRLYEISKIGEMVFLSHTQTRKWEDLDKNPNISVLILDKNNNQLISMGRAKLIVPFKNLDHRIYWDRLPEDDKKLYSGPAPSMELKFPPQYFFSNSIPETFGVIFIKSYFYEWYEVNWDDLARSKRVQYYLKKSRWIIRQVYAA